MVSIVAPQIPVSPSFVSLHGPMPHRSQHKPAEPILQGAMASARLNAVPIPISSAKASIAWAAGSVEASSGVRRFLLGILISSSAIV